MNKGASILPIILFLLTAIDYAECWSLPKTICTAPVGLVNTTNPRTVIGNGTAESCTQNALTAAVPQGGIITFNCGAQEVTIPIDSQLNISRTNDTTIDGGGLITLDGMNTTRIFYYDRNYWSRATPVFTVQRLRFINSNCQDNGGGCAILQKNGGTTVIINCVFENNTGAVVGQDTAGDAVWTIGGGETTIIQSVFVGNKCSNGGGVGILGSALLIYNSHFGKNQASGVDGNPGNGGNGGTISFDGRGRTNTICGTRFTQNLVNKHGGAFFRVSYNGDERNNFNYILFDSNLSPKNSNALGGAVYVQSGAVNIQNTVVYNNSAGYGGGLMISNSSNALLSNVNIMGNQASVNLGGGIFCAHTVRGTFTNITIANNYAASIGGATSSCNGDVTLANIVIANNTAGNVYSSVTCFGVMNNGQNILQSRIKKPKPSGGQNAPCANGTITLIDNVTVTLDVNTMQIQATGATPTYLGLTAIPGL